MKEITEENLKFDENCGKLFRMIENTVGKRAVTPFPTVLSKGRYCRHKNICFFLE